MWHPGGDTDTLYTEPAVPSTRHTKYSHILNDVEIIFPRTLSKLTFQRWANRQTYLKSPYDPLSV